MHYQLSQSIPSQSTLFLWRQSRVSSLLQIRHHEKGHWCYHYRCLVLHDALLRNCEVTTKGFIWLVSHYSPSVVAATLTTNYLFVLQMFA